MTEPALVRRGARGKCNQAKEAFYACVKANHQKVGEAPACAAARKDFEEACPEAWVRHFDKREVYKAYKQKLKDSGFKKLDEMNPEKSEKSSS
eukprot:m.118855 g.118855  ORF g.118855 m.118855 type:complete len:93 (-) comp17227_c0_seq1:445-723(-)